MITRAQDELDELKALFAGASQAMEGGLTYFLLPAVPLPEGCAPSVADTLLCAGTRDGYLTRLFFSEPIRHCREVAWSSFQILDRKWYALSWQGVEESLRLVQIVAAHLRALR